MSSFILNGTIQIIGGKIREHKKNYIQSYVQKLMYTYKTSDIITDSFEHFPKLYYAKSKILYGDEIDNLFQKENKPKELQNEESKQPDEVFTSTRGKKQLETNEIHSIMNFCWIVLFGHAFIAVSL